jgi:hypothetical protein
VYFFYTYTYTPVYTQNFQKLHLHNTPCKIKIGVFLTVRCFEKKFGVVSSVFFTPKKIGAKIIHCVIFGVFFKKKLKLRNYIFFCKNNNFQEFFQNKKYIKMLKTIKYYAYESFFSTFSTFLLTPKKTQCKIFPPIFFSVQKNRFF